MVAAKLSLRPTIEEDDVDIIPHRLQTKRLLRGGERNFKLVKADNTVSSRNKGNNIKIEDQQYRGMERKDSNIFVHMGML